MSPIGSVYTIFHESRRAARRRFCHEDRLQREKEPLFREKNVVISNSFGRGGGVLWQGSRQRGADPNAHLLKNWRQSRPSGRFRGQSSVATDRF